MPASERRARAYAVRSFARFASVGALLPVGGLCATLLVIGLCATSAGEARPREILRIHVDGNAIDVETARTPENRERGLKYRPELCANCGMLFVYPDEARRSFYTKHVFVALDIGYFGADGRLLEWRSLPADDARATFPASEPFQYALAVPAGWFAKHHIRRYATLELPHDLPAL